MDNKQVYRMFKAKQAIKLNQTSNKSSDLLTWVAIFLLVIFGVALCLGIGFVITAAIVYAICWGVAYPFTWGLAVAVYFGLSLLSMCFNRRAS